MLRPPGPYLCRDEHRRCEGSVLQYAKCHAFYTDTDNNAIYSYPKDVMAILYDWTVSKAFHPDDAKPTIARKLRQFRFKVVENLPKIDVLSRKHQQDFYFMLNERSSKRKEDQMFIVFPRKAFNARTNGMSTHLFGDHFTFQYNKDDRKTPVHIHQTRYTPITEDETMGDTTRSYANVSDGVDIDLDTFNAIPQNQYLIDMLSLPFQVTVQVGGKARRVVRDTGVVETYGKFENKKLSEYCQRLNVNQFIVTWFRGFC